MNDKQKLAAYVAALSPERLDALQRNAASQGQHAAALLSNGSAGRWFTGRSVLMWELPQ